MTSPWDACQSLHSLADQQADRQYTSELLFTFTSKGLHRPYSPANEIGLDSGHLVGGCTRMPDYHEGLAADLSLDIVTRMDIGEDINSGSNKSCFIAGFFLRCSNTLPP